MTPPVLLLGGAVLLLIVLGALALRRRRRARAVPAGPRTVAELVRQRAAAGSLAPAPVDGVDPATEPGGGTEPDGVPEPGVVTEPVGVVEPVAAEPVRSERAPARPVVAAPDGDVPPPLTDDTPWRRGADLTGTAPVGFAEAPEPAAADRPAAEPEVRIAQAERPAAAVRPYAVRPTAAVEPAVVEPVTVEPAVVEPVVVEPVAVEPAVVEPVAVEPVVVEPVVAVEPVAVEPVVAVEAVADEPVADEPVAVEPVAGAEPVVAEPVVAQADVAEPDAEPSPVDGPGPVAAVAPAVAPAALAALAAAAAPGRAADGGPTGAPAPDLRLVTAPAGPTTAPTLVPSNGSEHAPEPAEPVAPHDDRRAMRFGALTGVGALAAAAVGMGTVGTSPRPPVPDLDDDQPDPDDVVPPPAGFGGADPDLLFDDPAPDAPADRRDPHRLAAEQAAADLALLRTFGAADLASRPDRAPDVALVRSGRPEPEPAAGQAQPVRYRIVRHSGDPVADVEVALLDDRGRESSTGRSDGQGAGELLAPHPGSFVLVATAAGHQPGAVALSVADAPVETALLLVRSAVLTGTVTGEDGAVAGARVTLVQDGEVVDATNSAADGTFRVADLAAGEYAVSVAAAGCEPDVDLVVVPDEAEAVHDVELSPAGVVTG